MIRRAHLLQLSLFLFAAHCASPQSPASTKTRVVMLGTGTPQPDPDRSGPATAIVVNDTPYIVDAGTGVVRRAAEAARHQGVPPLEPKNLRIAFLTHLHSDHTLGLPDLILTPWVMGRKEPLELYGPPGTQAMVDHILAAYEVDRTVRTEGLEHANNIGWKVNVHEIKPGIVFKDANVTVTAFAVPHGTLHAYGYSFATPDRTIVISGDTAPTDAIAENCRACDILIAETYSNASFALVPQEWQRYRLAFHTSSQQLATMATKAKPGLLILYHVSNPGCDQAATKACRENGSAEQALKEVQQTYTGKVVAARDLDIY